MNKKTTEINKLLKQKQETCAQLLQRIGEQMEAVNNQNDSQLSVIIEAKEELVITLNETDQRIADLAGDLDEVTRKSIAHENEDLGRLIETDLEKIIEQETVCQEKLNLQKSEVVEKIKGLRKGQALLKGYERSQRIKPKISKNV
jgi:hypothetical protein